VHLDFSIGDNGKWFVGGLTIAWMGKNPLNYEGGKDLNAYPWVGLALIKLC